MVLSKASYQYVKESRGLCDCSFVKYADSIEWEDVASKTMDRKASKASLNVGVLTVPRQWQVLYSVSFCLAWEVSLRHTCMLLGAVVGTDSTIKSMRVVYRSQTVSLCLEVSRT